MNERGEIWERSHSSLVENVTVQVKNITILICSTHDLVVILYKFYKEMKAHQWSGLNLTGNGTVDHE